MKNIIIDRELLSYLGNPRYEILVRYNEVLVYDLCYNDNSDRFIVHRLYLGGDQCDSEDGSYLA